MLRPNQTLFTIGVILLTLLSLAGCHSNSPHPTQPAHHLGDGTYRNLYEPPADQQQLSDSTKKLFSPLRWLLGRDDRPTPKLFPIARGNEELWKPDAPPSISWIGHSTFYIRWNNLGIITDPHFSDRASPVSWAGPKRGTPPGRPLDSLPGVDLVLISHNHFDHLDLPTLKKLTKKWPNAHFVAPLGNAPLLKKGGASNIVEYDWWGENHWNGLRILCVPAHHWSKRSLWNKNEMLWSGWLIEHNGKKIWFSGDTGWGDGRIFTELRWREGEIDLALIPIGAYEPRDFMTRQHVDPQQAVAIHLAVGAKQSIGHHWGTFVLTLEDPSAPLLELRAALDSAEVDSSRFIPMQHGEIAPLWR